MRDALYGKTGGLTQQELIQQLGAPAQFKVGTKREMAIAQPLDPSAVDWTQETLPPPDIKRVTVEVVKHDAYHFWKVMEDK